MEIQQQSAAHQTCITSEPKHNGHKLSQKRCPAHDPRVRGVAYLLLGTPQTEPRIQGIQQESFLQMDQTFPLRLFHVRFGVPGDLHLQAELHRVVQEADLAGRYFQNSSLPLLRPSSALWVEHFRQHLQILLDRF